MNPLLAYSLNHKTNQQPPIQAQKEEFKNPFESAPAKNADASKKIPALNFAKLNTFIKDENMAHKSNQLEIITEETPKKTEITPNMVDIAEIRLNNISLRKKNIMSEQDLKVKNQTPFERHESLLQLKTQVNNLKQNSFLNAS